MTADNLCVLPALRTARLFRRVEALTDFKTARAVLDAVEEIIERDAFRWGNACPEKDCGRVLTFENGRFRCGEHGVMFGMSPTILLVGFRPLTTEVR